MTRARTAEIRTAYQAGRHGYEAPQNTSRLRRLAYYAGQRALGRSERERHQMEQERREIAEAEQRPLERALAASQGLNRNAIRIIDAHHQLVQHTARHSGGVGYLQLFREDGRTTWRRHAWLRSPGRDIDPSRSSTEPLIRELGMLRVEGNTWENGSTNVPVHNLYILSEAPAEGPDGPIGRASTILSINTRDEKTSLETSYLEANHGAVGDPSDQMSFRIDPDGTIAQISMMRSGTNSYIVQDSAAVAVTAEAMENFLTGVLTDIEDTVASYNTPDNTSGIQS